MREWSVESAVRTLRDAGAEVKVPVIKILTVGIKRLGAIDYLKKHGYIWVHEDPKRKPNKREEE